MLSPERVYPDLYTDLTRNVSEWGSTGRARNLKLGKIVLIAIWPVIALMVALAGPVLGFPMVAALVGSVGAAVLGLLIPRISPVFAAKLARLTLLLLVALIVTVFSPPKIAIWGITVSCLYLGSFWAHTWVERAALLQNDSPSV